MRGLAMDPTGAQRFVAGSTTSAVSVTPDPVSPPPTSTRPFASRVPIAFARLVVIEHSSRTPFAAAGGTTRPRLWSTLWPALSGRHPSADRAQPTRAAVVTL